MAENLVLRLIARTSAFERSMKKSRTTVTAFSGVVSTMAKRLAVVAGPAVMGYMIKQQMSAIDANAKLSDRIGVTTENLVALQHGANIMGVEQGTLNKSLEIFSRRLGEVQMGTGEAKRALDTLNLSASDLAYMSPDQAIGAVADAMNKLETQSDKAAAANYLFGRSGQQLLNLFSQGKEGITSYRSEVERLNMTYSRVDAAKVEAANDAIQRMKKAITGLATTGAIQIAPYLKAIADGFTDAATGGNDFGKTILSVSEQSVKSLASVGRELDKIITAIPKMQSKVKLGALTITRNATLSDIKIHQTNMEKRWTAAGRKESAGKLESSWMKLFEIDSAIDAEKARFPARSAAEEDAAISKYFQGIRDRANARAKASVMGDPLLPDYGKAPSDFNPAASLVPDPSSFAGSSQPYGPKYDVAAIAKVNAELEKQKQQWAQVGATIEYSATSALEGWISGTQSASDAFKSMASTIVAELIRVLLIQKAVNAAMGVFGMGEAATPTQTVAVAHSGWNVGTSPPATRNVNPIMFAGAPRLHNGLRSDEFPAILQEGEQVIPKGGGGVSVVINNNGTPQQVSMNELRDNVLTIFTEDYISDGVTRQMIGGTN